MPNSNPDSREPGTSMDDAHRRDYADLAAMRKVTTAIRDFRAGPEPTMRCHEETYLALRKALVMLEADMAHIVRAWD